MASESGHVIASDHFAGGSNVEQGSEKSLGNVRSGQSLATLLRRQRQGRFTASGAGDTTVTFSEELDTDNVVVILSSDTVAAVPIIKNGTNPDKTGFVVTVAAASVVHWLAIDDGPTS